MIEVCSCHHPSSLNPFERIFAGVLLSTFIIVIALVCFVVIEVKFPFFNTSPQAFGVGHH